MVGVHGTKGFHVSHRLEIKSLFAPPSCSDLMGMKNKRTNVTELVSDVIARSGD